VFHLWVDISNKFIFFKSFMKVFRAVFEGLL
jgi:hypothetical protein